MADSDNRADNRKKALIVAGFLFFYFVQAYTIALKKSNTWDESAHILAGYAYLNQGADYLSPLHHPVTGRAITALIPFLFLDLDFDPSVRPEGTKDSNFFPYSVRFLFENKVDGRRLLFLSRLSVALIGVLLGVYLFLWSRVLWGDRGAFLSLFFYSLSPNIIAHSALATTDLTLTAFFFISCYYLYRIAAQGPTLKRILALSVFTSLALTTKHTAFLLFPLVLLSLLLDLKADRPIKVLSLYAILFVLIFVEVWGIYGFRYHSPGPYYESLNWGGFSNLWFSPFFDLLRNLKVLPESYLYGIAGVLAGAGSGKAAFFMGEYSVNGWWHFFLVSFLIKTPIPTIILLAAGILYISRDREQFTKALVVLIPALLVFTVMSAQKVNIGLRHILPLYPFIFVMVGFAANIRTESRRVAKGVFYASLLWYVYSCVTIYPHQLAYFNEFVGGPKNGYKYLVDSSLDWGQDLPGLKRYMDERNIDTIKLAYFGLSDPSYYGIRYEYLPSYMILNPKNVSIDVPIEGWFAISATMLQGVYLPHRDFFVTFRDTEPVERIGYSIFIYKF